MLKEPYPYPKLKVKPQSSTQVHAQRKKNKNKTQCGVSRTKDVDTVTARIETNVAPNSSQPRKQQTQTIRKCLADQNINGRRKKREFGTRNTCAEINKRH